MIFASLSSWFVGDKKPSCSDHGGKKGGDSPLPSPPLPPLRGEQLSFSLPDQKQAKCKQFFSKAHQVALNRLMEYMYVLIPTSPRWTSPVSPVPVRCCVLFFRTRYLPTRNMATPFCRVHLDEIIVACSLNNAASRRVGDDGE